MIARVSIVAIVSALVAGASAQDANRLFDVSLSAAHTIDLSPVYQQVVREAIDTWRGDGIPIMRLIECERSPLLTSAINAPSELQEDLDPFPQVPFTLSGRPEEPTPCR